MRTIPNISQNLHPLDDAIDNFISVLFNNKKFNERERELFSLPTKLGGLGIIIPSKMSDRQYTNSRKITKQQTENIYNQNNKEVDQREIKKAKLSAKSEKLQIHKQTLEQIKADLPNEQKLLIDLNSENGASSWLTALPIKEQGFFLDKQSFTDALLLRYNFSLPRLPMNCVCGSSYDIEHALSCATGGFISIRHNELRDITANLLGEVCKDVCIEPQLQPLTGENLRYKTASTENEARVDVSARGFWVRGSRAFTDIRVFNPLARTYRSQNLKAAYKRNENEKKRKYQQRVQEIEHGTFTPLVFSCFGEMSRECDRFYKHLAERISEKKDIDKSKVTNWVRTKLSFSLLRSTLLCIWGSRSKKAVQAMADSDIILESCKARI